MISAIGRLLDSVGRSARRRERRAPQHCELKPSAQPPVFSAHRRSQRTSLLPGSQQREKSTDNREETEGVPRRLAREPRPEKLKTKGQAATAKLLLSLAGLVYGTVSLAHFPSRA